MTRRLLGFVLFAAVAVLGLPGAAGAAPAGGGWVRLAHLSPDTPAVDVRLTAEGAEQPTVLLTEVGYGDVSMHTRVPAGTYTVAMVPAGGDASDPPAVTGTVAVADGAAYTVAAVGLNADLSSTVVQDDLTVPAPGAARIRLLQASVSHPSVTVTAVDGPVLAADAAFATATGYAEIPAGSWSLAVTANGQQVGSATGVQVQPGSVNTLVVLDGVDGSTTVTALQDAVGSGVTPAGGVETGAGGAAAPATPGPPGVLPVVLLVVLGTGLVVLGRVVRRRAG